MPMVNGKKYPYSSSGRKEAKDALKEAMVKKMMAKKKKKGNK